jgi:glycosyltransferase involved in cell wall biosynthesis
VSVAGNGRRVAMLFHASFQPYQGHYLRAYNQACALVRNGYQVTLLAWDRDCRSPEHEVRDGIVIRRFHIPAGVFQGPRNALNVLKYNVAAWRALMRMDVDIIHCFSPDAFIAALGAARLRRKKAVLDLCEPDYYAFWDRKHAALLALFRRLERILTRRYDHVFVHNLYQVRKFKGNRVRNLTQVGSYPNRSMLPETLHEPRGDAVVVGRLGTIYENNGIEELVEAWRLLAEHQRGNPNPIQYKLLLAGRVHEPYRPTLEALLRPLGDQVILHGAYEPADLRGLYAQLDISAIFYRLTDWFRNITPTKLFESLGHGVPVLASDMGDVREIVESGGCGLVVDGEDPRSICRGIETLAADPARRRQMGVAALALARERYTWEACESQFLTAYAGLAAGRKPTAASPGQPS